jgi:hypothetical protein
MRNATKTQPTVELWREGVGQASPEQAAKENAFHARAHLFDTRLREFVMADEERRLRAFFEDSQLKLEIQDEDHSAAEEEIDNAVEEAESEVRHAARSAVEIILDDAIDDGLSLEELRTRLLARLDRL